MFLAKSKGPDAWKVVANAISTLLEEATFEVNSEGISFRGMDPSHVALIDINWPNSSFEVYECNREIRFGLRIDELIKLLKRANKNDNIEVGIEDDTLLILKIMDSYNKRYKIRLIDATSSTTPIPKLSFNTKVGLDIQTFRDVLDDIETVADYITISTKDGKILFEGRGDLGEASIELDTNENIKLDIKENSRATYSLEYLSSIIKAVGSNTEELTIEFSNAMPIKLKFKVTDVGEISFYLAPRVES